MTAPPAATLARDPGRCRRGNRRRTRSVGWRGGPWASAPRRRGLLSPPASTVLVTGYDCVGGLRHVRRLLPPGPSEGVLTSTQYRTRGEAVKPKKWPGCLAMGRKVIYTESYNYIFYTKAVGKYTGWRMNDFTAHGYGCPGGLPASVRKATSPSRSPSPGATLSLQLKMTGVTARLVLSKACEYLTHT